MISASNRPSGQHGGLLPPQAGGGGGRGGDSTPNYGDRLRRARLGLAVAMTPILMLFISFSVAYLVRRGYLTFDPLSGRYGRNWLPVRLPWITLIFNTSVLIMSSVTMEFARRHITREAALAPVRSIPGVSLGDERHFPWLAITAMLGFVFLGAQMFLWTQLASGGFHLYSGTSSSFVYFLTGMHALHLAGGILALLFANVAAWIHRPVEARRIVVDVTAWYWHFMAGLWIYIIGLLSFAAQ